ncbi:protoporphyrinogen oxidase [Pseudonocardia humida]|uniref:Coproporphyrinogen III oxidase n=1 Tax=Pseudonocardia humida TaxID=2800819 RepID=A0ABT0ZZ65_9PSEU|nr:protoporphyrinogen oxidase [Pseudonocardia humida]MCO1655983.1 protoporphyrinogen oxidase [Pseudonocardia humida]
MTVRVAVVGAGVSGLAAAHRLRTLLGPDAAITVLDQRDRTGGVLHTIDLAGVPFDVGAEAFLARRPEVPSLLAELGLAGERVQPTGAAPSVRAGGRTLPLPGGTLLGVPTSAARLEGLLSPAAVAAVAAEPARPLSWTPGDDVAVGGLLRARFGDEPVDRLADPLLGGVYAGRVDALGLRATNPALAAALDAGAPSLTAAADRATGAARPPVESGGTPAGAPVPSTTAAGAVFGAVRGGYARLLDALAAASAADIRLRTTVRAVERAGGGWRLTLGATTDPEALDVDAVVLAVPAPALARLLSAVAPGASAAAGAIELASSAVVALAYRPSDAATLPRTSGALIATGESLAVKGVTHSSTKWPHLSPDGLVRLRASMGRFGEARTLQVPDDELLAGVRADLATLAGISAAPVAAHVQRWGGGLPQYGVGHLDRVRDIERGLPEGLAVAGAALHGVGVPACIATARAAADRVVAALTAPVAGKPSSGPVRP